MSKAAPARTLDVADDRFPVGLLQRLIQANSANPPGNEGACIELLAATLQTSGLEPQILAKRAARPNLVARFAGRGAAPPLLLYGHADVVPASPEAWRHPPFAGELADGDVWGRGALDMKGGLAMLVTAFLRAARSHTPPPGDLLLAVTSDEETGGRLGAAFLVEEHAPLFDGVRHALSEFGGYTHHVGRRCLYPIQVAQKGRCLLQLTAHAAAEHAAAAHRDGAIARLARVLLAIERRRPPTHLTPPVALMLRGLADGLPSAQALAVRGLLRPRLTDVILRLAGDAAADLHPLLHNTAVPVRLDAGDALNTTPSAASAQLDGRLVPGHDAAQLVRELRPALPPDARLEVAHAEPPARHAPNLELLPLLASVLRAEDPRAHSFPLVTPGFTDARHFDRLGIQTYGFLPMRLPPGLMPALLHGVDERVPAAAISAGTRTLTRVLERYRTP